MAQTIPFISHSVLFIAGMTAIYQPLRTLVAFVKADTSVPKARRERILETFLRKFEGLPLLVANEVADLEAVWRNASPSRHDLRAERRGRWCQAVIAQLSDEVEILFAKRCAAMLTELYGNAVTALPLAVGQDA